MLIPKASSAIDMTITFDVRLLNINYAPETDFRKTGIKAVLPRVMETQAQREEMTAVAADLQTVCRLQF